MAKVVDSCPTEASIISITSEGGSPKDDTEEEHQKAVKDKGKAIIKSKLAEEDHRKAMEENVSLLSRANNMNEGTGENSLLMKTFSCKYCMSEFSSSQAFGGHQNAHKVERELEKRLQEMELGGAFDRVLSTYPYNSYPSLSSPNYKTYHRVLGARMESLIHKPVLNGWTVSPLPPLGNGRFGHGHGGARWSPRPIMLNQLNHNMLRMESLQAYNNGGFGRLLEASANNPRLGNYFGPVCDFGESSSSAAANLGLVMSNLTSTATGYHGHDNAEKLKSWGLDLSLKL